MKKFYAGYSDMGIEFTYSSPCWTVMAFDSKSAREAWVEESNNSSHEGHLVAENISRKDAEEITGCSLSKDNVVLNKIDAHMWEVYRIF